MPRFETIYGLVVTGHGYSGSSGEEHPLSRHLPPVGLSQVFQVASDTRVQTTSIGEGPQSDLGVQDYWFI